MSKVLVGCSSMPLSVTYSKSPNKKHPKGQAQPIKVLAAASLMTWVQSPRTLVMEGENSHKVKLCSGIPLEGIQSIVAEKAWRQRPEAADHMTSSQKEVNILHFMRVGCKTRGLGYKSPGMHYFQQGSTSSRFHHHPNSITGWEPSVHSRELMEKTHI
jgi:hypothetical protein